MAKKRSRKAELETAVPAARQLSRGGAAFTVRQVLARATGSRLCFGKPVRSGEVAVIPVASITVAGGGGAGKGPDEDGGGGGGGYVSATPIGYIEVTPDGAHFHRILDPVSTGKTIVAIAGAAMTLIQVRRMVGSGSPKLARRVRQLGR